MPKDITKGKTIKRLKAGISGIMKCEKFFFLKGETGNAKKCNDIIKKMSELVKKSKGGF